MISVVIPTYNRSKILRMTLDALKAQSLNSDEFEVIVVSDGSSDDTSRVVESYGYKYLYQENSGQGLARNNGVSHAKGDIIVFLQDDIVPANDCLKRHLEFHEKNTSIENGMLGHISWHKALELDSFMKWLDNSEKVVNFLNGPQNAFHLLKDGQKVNYNFFYSANISFKKDLLDKYKFDKDFSGYGWEDIELGYRIFKNMDFKLIYDQKCNSYHYHQLELEDLQKRMLSVGKGRKVFVDKHPELFLTNSEMKDFINFLLGNDLSLFVFKFLGRFWKGYTEIYWYGISKKYYYKGLREG